MKKIIALSLTLMIVFSLAACGGKKSAKTIIGSWQITDVETATEYGIGLEFTKDGKLRYGLTEELLKGITDGEADKDDWDDAMKGLDMLMTIEYKIKSDTEMEVTVSALLGLAKEKTTVNYSLDGDTLTFDGAVYTRMKK